MYKHKGRNEDIPFEAPNTRNKIKDEVMGELAGNEYIPTDTYGFKRAYEDSDGIYRDGETLLHSRTKSFSDAIDDLKLPFYQARNTKRYKDVDKLIKDYSVDIDGKKNYGIKQIVSHSLGASVGQQINEDYGNIFQTRSYGAPFISQQKPDERGQNLRIRGSNDVVSMFDRGAITTPKGSLNPLDNHSYADIANVKNKAGNEPKTREEFMEHFET